MRLLPAKRGPSPGLARVDPNAPVRAAANTAKGLNNLMAGASTFLKDYADATEETNVAEAIANYKKNSADLEARILSKPTIGFNSPMITDDMRDRLGGPQLDDYGVDISDTPEYLESHEVMQEIHDNETKKYLDKALLKITTAKGRDKFFTGIGTHRATSSANVVAKSLEWQRASMSVTSDIAMQTAIKNPDPIHALEDLERISEGALKNGLWDFDKYLKVTTEGRAAIEHNVFDRQIRGAGTTEELDDVRQVLHEAPLLMDLDTKLKLLDDIDSREKSIDTALHKDIKERKEESSGNARVDALTKMTFRAGPLTPSELRAALTNATETGDASAILSLQRVYQKEAADGGPAVKSNQMSMLAAQVIIQDLRYESEIPMADRRENARRKIYELAGVDMDSSTINSSGTISIKGDDLNKLMRQVEEAQVQIFKGPEMDAAIDTIWGLLTKGGKNTRDRPRDNSERFAYSMAVEAEQDLINAAANAGSGFSPRNWWAQNKNNYLTDTMKDNIAQIGAQFGKGVVKFKDGSTDLKDIDLAATKKAAEKKFPNFERRVIQIMDYATMAIRQAQERAARNAEEDTEDKRKR